MLCTLMLHKQRALLGSEFLQISRDIKEVKVINNVLHFVVAVTLNYHIIKNYYFILQWILVAFPLLCTASKAKFSSFLITPTDIDCNSRYYIKTSLKMHCLVNLKSLRLFGNTLFASKIQLKSCKGNPHVRLCTLGQLIQLTSNVRVMLRFLGLHVQNGCRRRRASSG